MTKERMMVEESYGFHRQPLLQDMLWGGQVQGAVQGAMQGGRNNNSDSSKNANSNSRSHLGAGRAGASPSPYGVNQFHQHQPHSDEFGQFCNGGTHLPESRMPDMHRPHYHQPHFEPEHNYRYRPDDREVHHQPPRYPAPQTHSNGDLPRGFREIRELRDKYGDEGPFVFGVDTPSQFKIGSRFQNDDTYDYADVAEDKTVIDDESESLYCDKKMNIVPSVRTDPGEAKRSMFRIDDNRTRNKNKRITSERKKARNKSSTPRKEKIKCVLVGDGAVGKTSLIKSYAQNMFQSDYKPTTFDNYNVVVEVDGRPIGVELCDTAGQDQDSLKGLRELCYPGTDVIMLCFSVMKPDSFRAIASRWAPAVQSVRAPLVLVGTQADLRECGHTAYGLKAQCESPVTESEAKILASKLNAPYIETSSKTKSRLKDVFDSAILAALPVTKKKTPFWKKVLCVY